MSLPVCTIQHPDCGACGLETDFDGDHFVCWACGLSYGDGEDQTEAWFIDDELPACGIKCSNYWHTQTGIAMLCESCKLPSGHTSDCWTNCGWG